MEGVGVRLSVDEPWALEEGGILPVGVALKASGSRFCRYGTAICGDGGNSIEFEDRVSWTLQNVGGLYRSLEVLENLS